MLRAGAAAIIDGRLHVSDFGNNRVLGLNAIPTANNAAADFVLGQANFTTKVSGTTASAFDAPAGVAAGNGKFAMSDENNDRVLIWNSVPTSNVAADVVVGAPDMTTKTTTCDASTIGAAEGLAIANGKLIVADSDHHRVLIWNAIPTANGQAADLVLGQPDFTTCTANTGGLGASSLGAVEQIWTDGTRLLVVDTGNQRVLGWNSFPTQNGQAADFVLGQADFTSLSNATDQQTLDSPIGVASNGEQIAVSDGNTNRILVWNSFATTNGASADVVLGQADFTSRAANRGGAVAANTLSYPAHLTFYENMLIAIDNANSRVLIYR